MMIKKTVLHNHYTFTPINTFIQLEYIKVKKRDISNVTKINPVLLNFLVIKESWKSPCFHKNNERITELFSKMFECFLSTILAY